MRRLRTSRRHSSSSHATSGATRRRSRSSSRPSPSERSSLVSTARAEKMEIYVDVDLLGLGDEGLLTPRVRPDEGEREEG